MINQRSQPNTDSFTGSRGLQNWRYKNALTKKVWVAERSYTKNINVNSQWSDNSVMSRATKNPIPTLQRPYWQCECVVLYNIPRQPHVTHSNSHTLYTGFILTTPSQHLDRREAESEANINTYSRHWQALLMWDLWSSPCAPMIHIFVKLLMFADNTATALNSSCSAAVTITQSWDPKHCGLQKDLTQGWGDVCG